SVVEATKIKYVARVRLGRHGPISIGAGGQRPGRLALCRKLQRRHRRIIDPSGPGTGRYAARQVPGRVELESSVCGNPKTDPTIRRAPTVTGFAVGLQVDEAQSVRRN